MARLFTSDLHLGHQNIIGFCDRPYDTVAEMDEDLVRRWNDYVEPDDEVVIVGDLAMGVLNHSLGFVQRMNGHKSLVPGNHDRMFRCNESRRAFLEERYTNAGIERILPTQLSVWIGGKEFLVNHFPYRGESVEDREDRYQESRPADHGQPLIHGHTHGAWRKRDNMVDVGVDAWGGYPVFEEELVQAFAEEGDLTPRRW